jgi:hypothetical protein
VSGPQLDFGGFDGRFVGVSVNIESERTARLIEGRANVDLTGLLEGPLEDQARVDALEAICSASVLSHEVRHFHDFLLAPLGAVVLRARLEAVLHVRQFLMAVAHRTWGRANCVPVPIPRWCRKSPAERAELLTNWNLYSPRQPFIAPELPYVTKEARPQPPRGVQDIGPTAAANMVVRIMASYETLRLAVTRPEAYQSGTFQPMHVHEASALLVQLQEIWAGIGSDATELFINSVCTDPRRPYAAPLGAVLTLGGANSMIDAELAGAIVNWSLLGNPADGIALASPVARFARLHHYLTEEGLPNPGTHIADLYARWDEAHGDATTLDTVRESRKIDERFVQGLADQVENARSTGIVDLLEETIAFYEDFIRARRCVIDAFLEDPDTYVHPARYLANLAALSKPPLKYVFSGEILPAVDSLHSSTIVHVSRKSINGDELGLVLGPSVELLGIEHISRSSAFQFLSYFTLADLLFSEFMRDLDDFDYEIALQTFHTFWKELRLISVLT